MGEAWLASPDGQDALRRIAAYIPGRTDSAPQLLGAIVDGPHGRAGKMTVQLLSSDRKTTFQKVKYQSDCIGDPSEQASLDARLSELLTATASNVAEEAQVACRVPRRCICVLGAAHKIAVRQSTRIIHMISKATRKQTSTQNIFAISQCQFVQRTEGENHGRKKRRFHCTSAGERAQSQGCQSRRRSPHAICIVALCSHGRPAPHAGIPNLGAAYRRRLRDRGRKLAAAPHPRCIPRTHRSRECDLQRPVLELVDGDAHLA